MASGSLLSKKTERFVDHSSLKSLEKCVDFFVLLCLQDITFFNEN